MIWTCPVCSGLAHQVGSIPADWRCDNMLCAFTWTGPTEVEITAHRDVYRARGIAFAHDYRAREAWEYKVGLRDKPGVIKWRDDEKDKRFDI